ncbi:unnamed protein product [Amoebophrya sp. A120]|nr:unnamed protein product [Amoebophrya sp. A120]|eukprot:GSA120T00014591001.1
MPGRPAETAPASGRGPAYHLPGRRGAGARGSQRVLPGAWPINLRGQAPAAKPRSPPACGAPASFFALVCNSSAYGGVARVWLTIASYPACSCGQGYIR